MTTKMKLYEITQGMETLLDLIDSGQEGWEKALDDLTGLWTDKAENVVKAIRMLQASANARKAEAKRLTDSAKADDNAAARLVDYIQHQMEALGKTALNTTLFKLRIQDTPPRVEAPNWHDVPIEFIFGTLRLPWADVQRLGLDVDAQVEPSIDRIGILEYYRDTGEAIQGTEIVQGKKLYIR